MEVSEIISRSGTRTGTRTPMPARMKSGREQQLNTNILRPQTVPTTHPRSSNNTTAVNKAAVDLETTSNQESSLSVVKGAATVSSARGQQFQSLLVEDNANASQQRHHHHTNNNLTKTKGRSKDKFGNDIMVDKAAKERQLEALNKLPKLIPPIDLIDEMKQYKKELRM